MLYIYISRRISRKTKYESNGKVDGKLAPTNAGISHNVTPRIYSFLMDSSSTGRNRLDTKAKPAAFENPRSFKS